MGSLSWTRRIRIGRWRLRMNTLKIMLMGFMPWLLFYKLTGSLLSTGGRASVSSGCRGVYRLGSVWYRQETAQPAAGACVPPLLTPPLLRRCVQLRARRRRRPTSVLLLGDSRMRLLYQHLADELGVPTEPEPARPNTSDWQRGIRWDHSPARWCRLCPWHCCSRAAATADVSLRFEWRPFWTEATVAELEAAAERCERRQPDCPDVVLLNGALWYMKAMLPVTDWRGGVSRVLLLLRGQLARAAAALMRLAAVTRTVWKLDEGVPSDVHLLLHSASPAEIPVVHSLVYDAARKIPGLVIWSSALPESSGFLRHTCYSLQGRQDPDSSEEDTPVVLVGGRPRGEPVTNNATFVHQCGTEALHVSGAVMTNAVRMVFAELCTRDPALDTLRRSAQDRGVAAPICCAENIGDDAL